MLHYSRIKTVLLVQFFDTSELSALTQALLSEGLNEEEVRAVIFGNEILVFQKYLP